MTTCCHAPAEGQACDREATSTVTFRLRSAGWFRDMPYCDEHAGIAVLQGGKIAENVAPEAARAFYRKPVRRRK